ncbi:MAG: response regulator transcription factor [Clostridia bacterium]|nr:response regulator transcription factor [Clostridia bacterium]
MKKIFILEDDNMISSIIDFNLKAAGYETVCEYDGASGLERLKSEGADLLVLDIMLPSMDGFTVLEKLRESSDMPVIILSARTDEQDKLLGLSLMADDYMTKPFSVNELIARIKVNLARYEKVRAVRTVYCAGDITVDCDKMTVTRSGENVPLTKKEFEILRLLMENRERVLSREQILEKVWGYSGYLGDLHTVDVAIGRLRAKIEKTPSSPELILSRRGAGYYIP